MYITAIEVRNVRTVSYFDKGRIVRSSFIIYRMAVRIEAYSVPLRFIISYRSVIRSDANTRRIDNISPESLIVSVFSAINLYVTGGPSIYAKSSISMTHYGYFYPRSITQGNTAGIHRIFQCLCQKMCILSVYALLRLLRRIADSPLQQTLRIVIHRSNRRSQS